MSTNNRTSASRKKKVKKVELWHVLANLLAAVANEELHAPLMQKKRKKR